LRFASVLRPCVLAFSRSLMPRGSFPSQKVRGPLIAFHAGSKLIGTCAAVLPR
jgi:hypothetical protein